MIIDKVLVKVMVPLMLSLNLRPPTTITTVGSYHHKLVNYKALSCINEGVKSQNESEKRTQVFE